MATVNLGTVGFGLEPNTKPLEDSLQQLKAFGRQVDTLSKGTGASAQQLYNKFANVERVLTSMLARTSSVTKRMSEVGMAAPAIDKVTMSYKALADAMMRSAGTLEKNQIGRGTIGMSAILGAAGREATKLNQSGTALTNMFRDLSGAAVLALGPLSGVGARLAVLSRLFDANTIQMALFVAGTAGVVIGFSLIAAAGVKATMQQQKFDALLTTSTGSSALAADEYAMVAGMADKFGVSIEHLVEPYAKFATAARLSHLSLKDQQTAFEGVTAAGRALNLSNEGISRTFLAFEQMLSKGTVQTQELKQQLGNELPGAFELAAKAMGMTQGAFVKAIASGSILATDLIPKLSELLKQVFGPAASQMAKNLSAEMSRFGNALFETEKAFDKASHMSQFFTTVVRIATDSIKFFGTNMQQVFQVIGAIAGAGGGFLLANLLMKLPTLIGLVVVGLNTLTGAIFRVEAAAALLGKVNVLGILLKIGTVAAMAAAGYLLMKNQIDPLVESTAEWIDKTQSWLAIQEAIGKSDRQTTDQMKVGALVRLHNLVEEINATQELFEKQVEVSKQAEEASRFQARDPNAIAGGPGPENIEEKRLESRLAMLKAMRDKVEAQLNIIAKLVVEDVPVDDSVSKQWDKWIGKIEKLIRSFQSLEQQVEDFAMSGKEAAISAESMGRAIELMEQMPEKGQGNIGALKEILREAGFEGIDLTHTLAGLFEEIEKHQNSLREMKAFPKILEAQTLAVEKMFADIRAKTDAAQSIIAGGDPEQLARMERLNVQIVGLTERFVAAKRSPEALAIAIRQLTKDFDYLSDSEEAAKQILKDNAGERTTAEAIGRMITSIDNENRLIGLTNEQRTRQNDLMQIEEFRANMSGDAFKRLILVFSKMRDVQEQLNKSWEIGAGQALRQYVEDVSNMAQTVGDLITGEFHRAEDALIEFVKTGKLNITSLADFMISEMLRIAIRTMILGPLANSIAKSFPGALGMFPGLSQFTAPPTTVFPSLTAGAGEIPGLASGTDYVPRNMLAFIHKGEAIIDAKTNAGGGRAMRVVYAPVFNIDSRTDRAQILSDMQRMTRASQAEFADKLQRVGATR